MDDSYAIVLASTITGLVALAATFIGPLMQQRHERWRAAREDSQLLRQKAHELFDELDRFASDANRALGITHELIRQEGRLTKGAPELGKIRAIVTIYFSDCQKNLLEFECEVEQAFASWNDYSSQFSYENPPSDHEEIMVAMRDCIKLQHAAAQKLTKGLREKMKFAVPRI